MEIKVQTKFAKIAPRKVRYLATTLKGRELKSALAALLFEIRSCTPYLVNLLKQVKAVAESKNNENKFLVKSVAVDGGPRYKRRRYASRGRSVSYQRKTCHITLIASDENISELNIKEENGTKD